MMPELGMDIFDMGMPPFPEPADPGANQEMQAQAESWTCKKWMELLVPEPTELLDPLPAPGIFTSATLHLHLRESLHCIVSESHSVS